jgi:hypothetical protein
MTENINDVMRIDTDSWKKDLPILQRETIEIFNLVPETHVALRSKLPDFDFSNPPVDANKFASSLVETCKKHGGIGLSANQCGYNHRVFVMGTGDNYVAFFNPEITWSSEEKIKMEEGFNQPIDVSSSIFGLCKQYINADAGVNPLDTSGVYLEFFPEHLQELESFSGNLIWNVLERRITLFTDEVYEKIEDFDECVWEKIDEPEPELVEEVPKKKKKKK